VLAWSEIARHSTEASLWTVIDGEVYDLTSWAAKHPGGLPVLLKVAGKDGSRAFDAAKHSAATQVFKLNYRIGKAAPVEAPALRVVPDERPAGVCPDVGRRCRTPENAKDLASWPDRNRPGARAGFSNEGEFSQVPHHSALGGGRLPMKIANALGALFGTLLLSSIPMAADARAADVKEKRPDTAVGFEASADSTLDVAWDKSLPPAKAAELKKSLEGAEAEQKPHTLVQLPDGGGDYPVVKCSDPQRRFDDRNGRFDVRYQCGINAVNWGFLVSRKLVGIADGPMEESGVAWHTATKFLGKNRNHHVPVDYWLHGTQRGISNNDILHWYDTITFRVNVGGNTGTAHLHIGGSFKVVR